MNLEIRRVFESYLRRSINKPYQDLLEHQFYQEQVVYWMRKTADELISLAYVIDEWKKSGSWPNSVKLDRIGGLIKGNPSNNLIKLFTPHMVFLSRINNISNAFKHSFINTDLALSGSGYPMVFALALEHNKVAKKPEFHAISFAEIVQQFSDLYRQVEATIRQWTRP